MPATPRCPTCGALPGQCAHPQQPTPFQRGMDGSHRAAQRWTPAQIYEVRHAIRWCATQFLEFTADDVYDYLGPAFPVTKGMAGQFVWAMAKQILENSGRTRIADRGGEHDHAQRLTIWRSRICTKGTVDA